MIFDVYPDSEDPEELKEQFLQLREAYFDLQYFLVDKAYQCRQNYKVFYNLSRLDLAAEQAAIIRNLEDIIDSAGLTREYNNYCENTWEQEEGV